MIELLLERAFFIERPPHATAEGWENWETWAKKTHPVRYFFSETLRQRVARLRNYINDGWYWLKSQGRPHNIVICRQLDKRWHDRDYLMFHACFQILTDFVEKEEPWEFTATREKFDEAYASWGSNSEADERWDTWQELKRLYHWYNDADGFRTQHTDVDYSVAEDNNLQSLIKHRHILWT